MKNYLEFEKEIKTLEDEMELLKSPGNETISCHAGDNGIHSCSLNELLVDPKPLAALNLSRENVPLTDLEISPPRLAFFLPIFINL